MGYRHVILDRDGVLNRELPAFEYVRTPADFRWLPGALEGLALLSCAGLRLSVVTNQSAIGRGFLSLAQVLEVHAYMRSEAAAHGVALDAVLLCPHAPAAQCHCRKPAPGLIHAALAQVGATARDSILLGDDQRDLEAARRAGVAAALVRSGKGRRTERQLAGGEVPVFDDLPQFARAMLATACC